MIDYFALALTHGLIVLAFWRLLQNDALDSEGPVEKEPQESAAPPGRNNPRA